MSDERDTLTQVIAERLRNFAPNHPTVRVWGRQEGHNTSDEVARDNAWAGDPEDVAEAVVEAASDWLAARDAAVAAQALRDAADEIELPGLDEGDWPRKSSARNNAEGCAEVWLRDRADSLGEAL